MAFFQTLCNGSYQECPGFCIKEDGRYPSATKLKLRNFPNKTWSQKKQTLCLLSTKVYRPTKLTWVALEFCISQNPGGLHSGALTLAFAVSQPKLEIKMPLWSPVHFLNLFFSHCSDQGWIWSTDAWLQLPWNTGCSAAGFLSEAVSSLAPRERRINTTGQETADAKNYRL